MAQRRTADGTDEGSDPRCLRPGEAARLLAGAPWRRIVLLGDSGAKPAPTAVVPGYGPAPWTDRVAAALREARPDVACLSLRGRRDLLISQVRSQQLASALAFQGDLALVACGGPDLRSRSFDADATELELSRVLASLRAGTYRHAAVISPFDLSAPGQLPVDRLASIRTDQRLLGERVQSVALRHGCLHIDLAEEGRGASGLWGPQPGRLSSRGHAVAAAATVRALGAHWGRGAGR